LRPCYPAREHTPIAAVQIEEASEHVGEHVGERETPLPRHYYIDESDPDVLVLRRQDGTFVAAFSASGATKEGIVEAAKEDYGKLLSRGAPPPESGAG
jgi:hypothetical protein